MTQELAMDVKYEDRRGPDRRDGATPLFSKYSLLGGRRAGERRGRSEEGLYVDRYESSWLLTLLAVCLFNLMDCFFTLVQIARGASELNPIVQYLIDLGPTFFIFTKSIGVGAVLLFLCVHKNFRLARATLYFSFFLYFSIFIYHLILFLLNS